MGDPVHYTEAGEFAVTVHWRGGRVDDLVFPKIVTIPQPKRTDESTLDLVRNLSAHYNDRTVASILNKQGRRTAYGLPFTRDLVAEYAVCESVDRNAPFPGDRVWLIEIERATGDAPVGVAVWRSTGANGAWRTRCACIWTHGRIESTSRAQMRGPAPGRSSSSRPA